MAAKAKSKKSSSSRMGRSELRSRSLANEAEPLPSASLATPQMRMGGGYDRAILMGPMVKPNAALKKALARIKPTSSDLLVGIDGGTEVWMKLGKMPGLAVGDWDSISPGAKKKVISSVRHLSLPQAKDRSDLYYAMASALQAGVRHVVVFGVIGGEMDHHLAALFELTAVSAGELGPVDSVTAYGDDAEYHFLAEGHSEWVGKVDLGTRFSLFALQGGAHGMDIAGAEYVLSDGTLTSSSQGISNFATESELSVKFRKGQVLLTLYTGRPPVKLPKKSGKR